MSLSPHALASSHPATYVPCPYRLPVPSFSLQATCPVSVSSSNMWLPVPVLFTHPVPVLLLDTSSSSALSYVPTPSFTSIHPTVPSPSLFAKLLLVFPSVIPSLPYLPDRSCMHSLFTQVLHRGPGLFPHLTEKQVPLHNSMQHGIVRPIILTSLK